MNEVNNIPEGWVETTLEEVVESANTGLDAIKRAPIVEEETGLKCFRIQDASQKKEFTNWGNTLVENKNYNKFKLIEGDILIARTGNTIGVHYLVKQNLKSVFNNGLIRLRANRKIDYKFLYKIIESGSFERFIQSIAYGTSTQPNMQINVLLSFKISLPPLPEQKSIAAILTSFDDKIELLQAQNKTLEELAQTIFKEWFGKYNIDDELPDGWGVGKLSDFNAVIADFVANGSFASLKENVTLYDYEEYALFMRNTDLKSGFVQKTYVDKKSYEFLSKTKLFGGEIIISNVGDVGSVHFCPYFDIPMTLGNNVIMLKSEFQYYFYTMFNSKIGQHLISSITGGSAQPKFNKTDFRNMGMIIPSEDILLKFEDVASKLYLKILKNKEQIQTLTKTRDALLPKLMSGEIRVKN